MKTEPETFSIDDLQIQKSTWWEGVRNYQARNYMMNSMSQGDVVWIYHSSCPKPGIVGQGFVSESAKPDLTALDSSHIYFDPKSTIDKPIWYCVKIDFKSKLNQPIFLEDLRKLPSLSEFNLLQKGNRLSILPVNSVENALIENLILGKDLS